MQGVFQKVTSLLLLGTSLYFRKLRSKCFVALSDTIRAIGFWIPSQVYYDVM
jgi:hypothetical protein